MKNRNVPIFMYHDIVPQNSMKDLPFERRHYAISVDQFKSHLELIIENGFQTKTVDEVSNINHEQKVVVLTFDDGHISQYQHAFKILQEFGLTGSFFIVPSWINQPDFIHWEMVQEMSDLKMSIQSHTNSHQFLIQLMSKQIVDEIKISKKTIEDKTGRSVNYLSLPGGRFERKIWQLAGFYGYKGIFTSKPGYGNFTPFWMKIHPNRFQPTAFHRIAISSNITSKLFETYLLKSRSFALSKRKTNFFMGTMARKILGDFSYDKIWRLREKYLTSSSKEQLTPVQLSTYEKTQ